MSIEQPKGQRYSLLYLRPEEAIKDSKRLRFRLLKLFDRVFADADEASLGGYLERELGIRVLQRGYNGAYIDWDDVEDWELRDVLCTITLAGSFLKSWRPRTVDQFSAEVSRILSEESATYVIDENLGVHPAVDAAFRSSMASSVRALGAEAYNTARKYVERADEQLMPDADRREAVRAVFAAVENIFKMTFDGSTQLNSATIRTHLRPWLERMHDEPVARRVSLRLCDSLQDWTDACHNYRHAEGEPEPEYPPEDVAVLLVSQGISFLRWLVDLRRKDASQGERIV